MLGDEIELRTRHGVLAARHYRTDDSEGMVIHRGLPMENPAIRIHSSCVFSESLGASGCDCAIQLEQSLAYVGKSGGLVIYRFEEGRGVGLANKFRAVRLQQERGIDTKAAFEQLGYPPDLRHYRTAAALLREMNIGPSIRLITKNPNRVAALEQSGFKVERFSLPLNLSDEVRDYVSEKVACLGHYGD